MVVLILSSVPATLRSAVGWLLLAVGASVFAIRLQHEGPYAIPRDGNLLAAVLALGFGVWLARPALQASRLASSLTAVVLLASPVVLFFALYATLAELEEVVVLRTSDGAELRLWVVDHEGMPWVTMPRSKADAHGLTVTDARAELVRNGVGRCVIAKRHEERASVDRTHRLRHEKYRIQRLATSVGLFGRSAGENTVTLSLAPCP